MSRIRAFTLAWRDRMAAALTDRPETTRALASRCAVPMGSAKHVLAALAAEQRARKVSIPRTRAGGFVAVGWAKPEARA